MGVVILSMYQKKIETVIEDLKQKKELDKTSSHAYDYAIEQLSTLLKNVKSSNEMTKEEFEEQTRQMVRECRETHSKHYV